MRPQGLHLPRDERRALVEIARHWTGLKKDFIAKYGVTRNTANSIFDEAGRPEPEPAQDQWTEYEKIHVANEKPRIRVKVYTPDTPPEGPVYRVLGIGDVHDQPGRTKEHLRWIGRHAAETAPDLIVCIGDFLSLSSLSTHPTPGSFRDANRPSLPEELESGEEALNEIDREAAEIRKHLCYGNHDGDRPDRAADADPRRNSDIPVRVEQVFARFRWSTSPYGKMHYVGGCGFTHVPLNVVGKPYSGKHSENTIGNDATHSIIWGHDHRYRFKNVAKIGPNNKISLCNLGSAMPYGVIEDYSVGTTGWSYGVVDLRIQGGIIVSARFHCMTELRARYGD
jgi:predicted phosphodiesterase